MADVSVHKFNSAGTESFSTIRKTGWFSLSDLSKNVFVRRLNARYDSSDDVSVNIYADGDSDSPVWTGTMPKNGVTGATLSSSATDSDTTLDVTDTSKITSLDKILVDKEIMSVQDLVTNGTFDTDTDSWNGDDSWANGQLVVTSNGSAQSRSTQGFSTVVGKVYRVLLLTPCNIQLLPLLIYKVFGVTPVLKYEEPRGFGDGVVPLEGTPLPVVQVGKT